jgi:hypothetical protein
MTTRAPTKKPAVQAGSSTIAVGGSEQLPSALPRQSSDERCVGPEGVKAEVIPSM